ncbi:MAG: peptide chain release factor N(5)-glutamine methyltransferase [Phycisphaerales bacterium]|jgi:release factor glutamine methyltransferase|nr:peptide chain release factor N(5)-glutamine methyltransferase [Phycisphaerales bacterium]MBT7170670.1 peptide chain release factor N(5)-glutamine methyltransferase [Phycisphaerales bacterium]
MTNQEPWTVGKLLSWTQEHFTSKGLDAPRLCAEMLLAEALGCERLGLYTRFGEEPEAAALGQFREWVRQAAAGEPVAYLVGRREFYSLVFEVSPAVLIPRPETELLVDQAIDFLRSEAGTVGGYTQKSDFDALEPALEPAPQPESPEAGAPAPGDAPWTPRERAAVGGRVWDVCTGSGCIAAAIAKNVPDATVLATDLSAEALEVAQRNFDALDLGETVSAREANLLDLSPDAAGGLFDVIVSNPPYVGAGDDLGWGVDREPAMALFAGDDGLDLIRTMVAQAPQHLRPGGLFAMEFGLGQADDIRDLLLATGQFAEPIFLRDHNDIERIVTTQKL